MRRVGDNVERSNSDAAPGALLLKGFNSDVIYKGLTFHVQTEDWGRDNPYLVSRVYQAGAVIKSVKTHYSEVLQKLQMRDPEAIRLAMRNQHQQILDLLVSGQLL